MNNENTDPLHYIQEPEDHPRLSEPSFMEKRQEDIRRFRERFHITNSVYSENDSENGKKKPIRVYGGFCIAFISLMVWYVFISPPRDFPQDHLISVVQGETISGFAQKLYEDGLIKNQTLFKVFVRVFGGTAGLRAGDYHLERAHNVVGLGYIFGKGVFNLKGIRVTIPEGMSSLEIARRLEQALPDFDAEAFSRIARPFEGYLFPDTYIFLPNVTPKTVVETMVANFDKRIASLENEIAQFGKPLEDIVIMASIIEKEATADTREIIAGILWKRLDINMPLQVDATFAFVNGKTRSEDLTLSDLAIDSPYNTYVYRGLPPGAIGNPGLAALRATISPLPTQYFFYLTDRNGVMRYGVTHDEHIANKNQYLR